MSELIHCRCDNPPMARTSYHNRLTATFLNAASALASIAAMRQRTQKK